MQQAANIFPKGVEVVTGAFIFGGDGRLALASAHNWKSKLVPPGGHVEPGETVAEASVREAYEETGLTCEFIGVLNVGEFINDSANNFNRSAHMIFMHVLLQTSDSKLVPQKDELMNLEWYKADDPYLKKAVDEVGLDSIQKALDYFSAQSSLIEMKKL